MNLPKLKIRDLVSRFPVIQAGMGVRIGDARLAAAAIECGAFGVVSTVGLGIDGDAVADYVAHSSEQVALEIRRAREMTGGKKPLGVNIMVATTNYEELVRTAVDERVDFIISGAGLPTKLPAIAGDADIALIPVVSSGRALMVVLKSWIGRHGRKPDAVIVEGPRCGGHLGFSYEEIAAPETRSLQILLAEVKQALESYNCVVPVLAAGEVSKRADIEGLLKLGYDGVQIGTKFITAEEAGIDRRSKEYFIQAKNTDVTVITSPVGLPVRVLRSPLVQRVQAGGRERFACKFHCLRTCQPAKVPFCIAQALIATVKGDIENGLFMVGCDAESLTSIYPLSDFFKTLE